MLTVKQVAEQLGVSAACIYQLVGSGKLSAHRIGLGRGAIRISESDLTEFVESSRKEKRPGVPAAPLKQKSGAAFKHLQLDRSFD